MVSTVVSISQEEGDKLFRYNFLTRRLFPRVVWLIVVVGIGFFAGGVFVTFTKDSITLWPLIAGFVLTGIGSSALTFLIGYTKEQAVKQCLAVADKRGLRLSAPQNIELLSKTFPGDVYQAFVVMVEEQNPSAILTGFFIGAGGKSDDSCRSFVRFLWEDQS